VLVGDLIRQRRPPQEAWELYRLNTHPGWLDHLTSDRFLSPAEFAQRYTAAFPPRRHHPDVPRPRPVLGRPTPARVADRRGGGRGPGPVSPRAGPGSQEGVMPVSWQLAYLVWMVGNRSTTNG
jgi:hypothetical protein